ncbi:MAG: YdeI family protein [Saprospiraceae bacterium]
MNPKVDFYFEKEGPWQEEQRMLRSILLDCTLTEELKWGVPCYTYNGKNIALIHEFKSYCAVLFVKGALLKDTDGILVQQTEQVQAARQVRFTNTQEVHELETTLKAYLFEAIEVEKAGLEVPLKKTSEYPVPEELQAKFEENPDFKTAFEALTPGRQRGYLLYFSQAKQAKTREARIEKYRAHIFQGKGIQDK